jgi:hypothetical protein
MGNGKAEKWVAPMVVWLVFLLVAKSADYLVSETAA